MGFLNKMMRKAESYARTNPEKTDQLLRKAGDFANRRRGSATGQGGTGTGQRQGFADKAMARIGRQLRQRRTR